MQIVITVEDRDPPSGVVTTASGEGGAEDVPFTGWLGLLGVLSEIIEPPELERGGG